MKIGIVGMPNVGKSTLFNALTNAYNADAANFPFCTIDPNIGTVEVRDPRLKTLATMSGSEKILLALVDFVDIAGLVKGASQGQGMGNAFLSHIRQVDAIVHVVRHFMDEGIIHVDGRVDPMTDADVINTELMLADLDQIEKKIGGLQSKIRTNNPDAKAELAVFSRVKEILSAGKWLANERSTFSDDERSIIRTMHFLSAKPMLYAINVSMDDLADFANLRAQYCANLGPSVIVCASLEYEMIGMEAEDKHDFLMDAIGTADEGAELPTLDTLIAAAFDLLGLMYYFTTGPKETRAWATPKQSTAPQAAAKIHKDFEKKFIRAEVVNIVDMIAFGSRNKAKDAGKMRVEGKEYIVQDGDVLYFRIGG